MPLRAAIPASEPAWLRSRSKVEPFTFPQRIYHFQGASAQSLGLDVATIAIATGDPQWQQYGARLLSTLIAELEVIQVTVRQ